MLASFFSETVVVICLRTFLAVLFISSALPKLQQHDEFHGVVRNFRLLPTGITGAFAWAVPVLEIALAIGLCVRPVTAVSAVLAAVLLLAFGAAIAINVMRGRTQIDCGCMRQGGMTQGLSWLLVLRNVVLAAVAATVAAVLPELRTATTLEIVAGMFAGATAILLYLSASVLAGIAPRRTSSSLSRTR